MECRCYCGGTGRTRMRELHLRPAEWLFLLGLVVVAVAVGLLAHLGL